MRNFFIATMLTFCALPAFASTLKCVTAYGGYDEVQKFQIVNYEEVRMGERRLESSCLIARDLLECDFAADRLRSYTVVVDLKTGEGVIGQAFRKSNSVRCSY